MVIVAVVATIVVDDVAVVFVVAIGVVVVVGVAVVVDAGPPDRRPTLRRRRPGSHLPEFCLLAWPPQRPRGITVEHEVMW